MEREGNDLSKLIKDATNFFKIELKNPDFPDGDVRTEFYVLAHGATRELEAALFDVLKQHRPHVAEVVKEELELEN